MTTEQGVLRVPPCYRPVHDLDPRTRRMIEETALAEIDHFRAWGDAAAIERLAQAGRIQDWGEEEGLVLAWQVSDVQDEIAARLKAAAGPAVRTNLRSGPERQAPACRQGG